MKEVIYISNITANIKSIRNNLVFLSFILVWFLIVVYLLTMWNCWNLATLTLKNEFHIVYGST